MNDNEKAVVEAAKTLVADVRERYPETVDPSTIRCPVMRALHIAVTALEKEPRL